MRQNRNHAERPSNINFPVEIPEVNARIFNNNTWSTQ